VSQTDLPRDRVFAAEQPDLVDFAFDERVAAVFPDMIRRSVPGYTELVALLGLFASRYAQPDTRLYDLGCSLGAASLSLRARLSAPGCRIIAVDNSPAMLARCADNLRNAPGNTPVELIEADVREVTIENASLVVMNFTQQFLPPDDRDALIARIHAGLRPGGALLLAEKLSFDNPASRELFESLYADFKRANGYSELEIAQKRSALERVMQPDTLAANAARLRDAGFAQVENWFRCLNFSAWVAVK
jgi:tRNA (cmo5U34)-methyltransferase